MCAGLTDYETILNKCLASIHFWHTYLNFIYIHMLKCYWYLGWDDHGIKPIATMEIIHERPQSCIEVGYNGNFHPCSPKSFETLSCIGVRNPPCLGYWNQHKCLQKHLLTIILAKRTFQSYLSCWVILVQLFYICWIVAPRGFLHYELPKWTSIILIPTSIV